MLEQNLKGQYRGTYLDYFRRSKELVKGTAGSELCGVMYVRPSLKSHAGIIRG